MRSFVGEVFRSGSHEKKVNLGEVFRNIVVVCSGSHEKKVNLGEVFLVDLTRKRSTLVRSFVTRKRSTLVRSFPRKRSTLVRSFLGEVFLW